MQYALKADAFGEPGNQPGVNMHATPCRTRNSIYATRSKLPDKLSRLAPSLSPVAWHDDRKPRRTAKE